MQREVGPQVASPLYLHHQIQPLPPHAVAAAPKKRGNPWPAFTARPSSDALRLGAGAQNHHHHNHHQQQQRQPAAMAAEAQQRQGPGGLSLQLATREEASVAMDVSPTAIMSSSPSPPAAPAHEQAARPSKKVRSESPGTGSGGGGNGGGGSSGNGGGSYPMCQVDDCRADLTSAKDYHRRHKVCEIHSKTTKAVVGHQMQRFCQQCSRFHPLSEFDEGKRSCRRRLAGHNRRRRKTQPTDVASQLLLPDNQENAGNRTQDIVNLITVIARLQGGNVGKLPSIPPIPDKDNLVQIISKINSINTANALGKSPPSEVIDLNASHGQQQDAVQKATNVIDKQAVPSTMDLLTVLSGGNGASTPETNTSQSQGSSDSSGNNKSKSHSTEPAYVVNSHEKSIRAFPAAGVIRSNSPHDSPPEMYKQPDRDARPFLSLQLFGSTYDDIPAKMDTANKYLSSESSNPMDERSPSSSPPVTHTFFPIRSANDGITHPRAGDYGEDAATVENSTTRAWCAPPLELFKDSERPTENGSPPNLTYQSCYASTSGSDHSPSTSNSDGQDRTGRIIFKLFGKEPGSIPGNLRDEVVNWLKHSPTEMEGYIRPGCLVLSMYLSMPAIAWDELEENLLHRVNTLIQGSDSDFWRNGRFLVRSDNQLVSYKDGTTRLSKSWRTWNTPELTLVTPIAVVGGRKSSLILKGRNLTIPGTQIHCTTEGKYISKEVLCSAYPGTIYDDSGVETFNLPGEPNLILGRCFIEVENRFRGNSFPVIFANSSICQELRNLEAELEDSRFPDVSSEDQVDDTRRLKPRDQVLHFLNELGWLFQKAAACIPSTKSDVSDSELIQFSTARFRYLLLFSNERDWCSLTKTLLDILSKRSLVSDELSQETLEMLSEIHLLNRAVKRKSRRMVHLLVQFVVICPDNSKLYPFLPNYPGPGGLTPLHLAASIDDAEGVVDALTDDPQQIGLNCWHSVLDDDGQSPEAYAKFRNNDSYNELVAQKLVDKKNSQVTIVLNKGEICMDQPGNGGGNNASGIQAMGIKSCSQCAILESGLLSRPMHSRGLLARPYIHSMLAIAAVCVCVCVFMRALLRFNSGRSFKWERLDFGTS
ncbi:squamosa promoter-binding-like protein 15 isoform X2 [Brachypodium distachyon]|uniref:squamosa promoter-binding-like protein 15 isoform X2 n=1 Tax=Brachypodium distachyon TaxID=15368 RepID=UPI000D0D3D08|nr:squamosa promoter-binding-like protein 15 isoform X2 [Brachypodium distachyon]|eukprot:XP_024316742.1 squamosa promoter-binding-like protein 15 isoform X2 [Brachypodium distachyon]